MDWDRNDYLNEGKRCIPVDCRICGNHQDIWVEDNDIEVWISGKESEEAFTYLNPSQHRMLDSMICQQCFDILLGNIPYEITTNAR